MNNSQVIVHVLDKTYLYLLNIMTEEKINSSSSSKRVLLASLNNQGIIRKDKLSACCNVKRYQIRRVKNKGALLVLVISYLVTSIIYFLATIAVHHPVYQVWLVPFTITTAIAGWLTDAFIGRYKVTRCSVWIMWLLMIAITVSAVVGQLNEIYHRYNKYIYCSNFTILPDKHRAWSISIQYHSVWTRSAPRCFNNPNKVFHSLVCELSNHYWICRTV